MDPSKLDAIRLTTDGSNWASYRDKLFITQKVPRWREHLTSATITQAYKHIVVGSLPQEFFIRIKAGANAKMWWGNLKAICESKSRALLIDLGRRMQNTMCGEDDDVRIHFAMLANIQEQLLVAMGESVSDQHYSNILLASLPQCYEVRVVALTTNADNTDRGIEPSEVK